jgi:DNA-binding response OmpR family regulator
LGVGRVIVVGTGPTLHQYVGGTLSAEGFHVTALRGEPDVRASSWVESRPVLAVLVAVSVDTETIGLCAWLKARASMPIVVVTEHHGVDTVPLFAAGADMVLNTPVGKSELVARVRALLRRAPSAQGYGEEIIGFGGMKLHCPEHTLYLEDGTLHLDGEEFLLMQALITAGGTVIPRPALMATLAATSSELDGHVRRLRDHLEAVERWRRIMTVRGLGFRLLDEPPA